jgi:hypothetical protein
LAGAAPGNLVENGAFEKDADADGVPDGWTVAGRRDIKQRLERDAGREGGHSVKLSCTEFVGGTPDAHAMICQVGAAGVTRGQWYRLSFWVKGRDIERSSCHRGQAKPIWLTEIGCYADDDPCRTPSVIGDSAMSRANWPSERHAAEALVKTAAAFLSHGVTKIFYHAGTCGPINGRDGGGIFFEYGGAPRKMVAAQSTLANLLGPDPTPLPSFSPDGRLRAYLFETASGALAVTWSSGEQLPGLPLGDQVAAKDIMGNTIERNTVDIGETPLYLTGPNAHSLREVLRQVCP